MIVTKYGNLTADTEKVAKVNKATRQNGGGSLSGTTPVDTVVLRTLVEAGTTGVAITNVGEMLSRRGKATRGALREWSKRVGLTQGEDNSMDSFEECRVGTVRGLRIKPSLLEVAKELLKSSSA